MKVCFISHSSQKGGAERAMIEIIDALRDWGVESCVIMPSLGPLIEDLKTRQVPYEVIPYKWWMGKNPSLRKRIKEIFRNLWVVIPVVRRLRRCGCEIVYTNTITVCVGALAARILRIPHVWHIHEFGYEHHGLTFYLPQYFSLSLMNRFSTMCITNSRAVYQKFRRYIESSKLKVIYNSVIVPEDVQPVNLDESPKQGIKCVIVGPLQEGKRQEDAIRAVSKLLKEGIEVNLYIVGDGDPEYKRYLQKLVIEDNIENNIKFLGYKENPFPLIKASDVLLMCSICEAFGRVTVEAMKLGKPVIGAKSGGTIELIREGFNGLFYTPGNYMELADRIRWIYENPNIARHMGENAQQWAWSQFRQERLGGEIMELLKEVVNK